MKILFLCTGNTCRSAMAQVIAERIFSDCNLDIYVDSAGTHVFKEDEPAKNAVITAKNHGLDLSGHISKQVTQQMIDDSDIVLVMSISHKDYILIGNESSNVYTLSEYADCGDFAVDDPFGGDLNEYEQCFAQIEKYIKKIGQKLRRAGEPTGNASGGITESQNNRQGGEIE